MQHVLPMTERQLADRALADADAPGDLLLRHAGFDEAFDALLDVHSARICLKAFTSQAHRHTPQGLNAGMQTFAQRIEAALKYAKTERGLTQEGVGDLVGLTQGQMSKLKQGDRKSSRHTIQIARALGVDPDWLATGKGAMLPALSVQEQPAAYMSEIDPDDPPPKVTGRPSDIASLAETLPPLYREAAHRMVGELAKLAGIRTDGQARGQRALHRIASLPKGPNSGESIEPRVVSKRGANRRTKRAS